MPDEMQLANRASDLEQLVASRILIRTQRRIHDLSVQVIDTRVVIHGRVSSYYFKQLALEGALEAIDPNRPQSIDLLIEVKSPPAVRPDIN